ncbi:MAG TPA: zinc-binding dehydrogenase [Actinomycetota bacterium]|nr:zinc-binding dehydrogenase [Actinomycetota bacterium]
MTSAGSAWRHSGRARRWSSSSPSGATRTWSPSRGLQAGTVTPVVERTYALSETAHAFRYLGEGHARGKLVVTV